MKTVGIAPQQDEIVFVAKRRKSRFARVWQVPSPSKARRGGRERAWFAGCCKCFATTDVRLD
jgi:hypothetical protein